MNKSCGLEVSVMKTNDTKILLKSSLVGCCRFSDPVTNRALARSVNRKLQQYIVLVQQYICFWFFMRAKKVTTDGAAEHLLHYSRSRRCVVVVVVVGYTSSLTVVVCCPIWHLHPTMLQWFDLFDECWGL